MKQWCVVKPYINDLSLLRIFSKFKGAQNIFQLLAFQKRGLHSLHNAHCKYFFSNDFYFVET